MNYEIFKAAVIVAVLAASFLLLCAIDKGMTLKEEYDEWSTQKRRAKYRRSAYADVYRRRCQSVNRDELWRRFVK